LIFRQLTHFCFPQQQNTEAHVKQPVLRLFGRELGRYLGDVAPQSLLISSEVASTIAITRIRNSGKKACWTESILPEKGFTIPVYLTQPNASGWATSIDGSVRRIHSWEAGGVGIYDLESDPRVLRSGDIDVMHFNLPKATLGAFTESSELPSVTALCGVEGRRDEILYRLAQMILPSIAREQQLPNLFLDYFVQVVCSHVVSSYSEVSVPIPAHRGGLSPSQKRRTLELLELHLAGDLRLARLAAECGLSSSHFSRCFRKSFGVSVHQFVIQKRVERARDLLLRSRSTLAEIAIEAGFSDQAAFSRTFSVVMGIPPARWKAEHVAKSRSTAAPQALLLG
jgi:AraC family transcriptional regulator